MLTKNQTKRILSLSKKKYRQEQQCFVAEGPKVVQEFLDAQYDLVEILSTSDYYQAFGKAYTKVSEMELNKISNLKTPNVVVAIFKIPTPVEIDASQLIVALDGLNNPGNLGTIIRLCDWFGVKDLVCSINSVDCYNSKVIQSAMGSHTRVTITYTDLALFLKNKQQTFGTFMDGKSIYEENLPQRGVIVLGNEANGISDNIESILDKRIAIPRYGDFKQTESLNVANAAAIILGEFRRRSTEM
ncbi:MAG: TrmH family RNA methyltransferase [Flavobacteriaceae bacterium]